MLYFIEDAYFPQNNHSWLVSGFLTISNAFSQLADYCRKARIMCKDDKKSTIRGADPSRNRTYCTLPGSGTNCFYIVSCGFFKLYNKLKLK